ncbi:MAG: MaoC family dehydratase N-terminal domain-containing protein [Pseudomonadaceae bacterium]|nr:MaoC family dehydratase N-terminal domain-containing protein [Pseudomonadaceae bacterium]
MPLSTNLVGSTSTQVRHTVDNRWLMAYAAGIDAVDDCYLDTTSDIACHPVFPVCLEWPAILAGRDATLAGELTQKEAARAVHAGHDLHWHARIHAGDVLTTTSTIVSIRASRAGAVSVMRLDTSKDDGALVCRTWQTTVYRGVETAGEDRTTESPPSAPAAVEHPPVDSKRIAVAAGAAHVYSECARIWNPIHTDRAVARAAGLPDIILHGTATLAIAVSELVRHYGAGEPALITRLGGEFRGQVAMPSDLNLRSSRASETLVTFNVAVNDSETLAIRNGFIELKT